MAYAQCGTVLRDAAVAGVSTAAFAITTTQPNELIMIAYNGWSTPGLGPVTVDGNAACHINTAFDNNNSGIAETYAYAAAAAGVHNIVCTEPNYSSPYYLNSAASFYVSGQKLACCSVITSDTAWRKCITGGTIFQTINVTIANSMIYCNAENNNGNGTSYPFSWTNATFQTNLHVGNGIESSQAWKAAAATGAYTITASNLAPNNNGCGGLALVLAVISCNSACPLPVELQKFECSPGNGAIKLDWATATEENSSHFNVQRSADGVNFTTIATVKAAGEAVNPTMYSYTDKGASYGANYYRLEEVDFDGNSQTFHVSECSLSSAAVGTIYPNPNNGSFTISLSASTSVQTVIVLDMVGKEVYRQQIPASATGNNYTINLPANCKGVFTTQVLNGNVQTAIKKIVVY